MKVVFLYVFRGHSFPLHFGVSVTGIFSGLAAVAFLPPPHSTFAALRMAAVSPTAKSLKIRSDSANNVTGKQLPPE
jgi:hypothetical protein